MRTSIEEQLMNFAWIMLFDDFCLANWDESNEWFLDLDETIYQISKRTVLAGSMMCRDERWLLEQLGL